MTLNTLQKIENTLEFLYEELSWVYLYYFTNKAIYQSHQKSPILFRNYFFSAAYEGTLSGSVLGLSKLIIKHSDSISFDYLFNLVEIVCSQFPYASKSIIQSSLRQHRSQLKGYQQLIDKLKYQRDKRLAHADKDLINQSEKMKSEPGILLDEIESCLQDLLTILNTYRMYLKQSEYNLSKIQENVQTDVDYLVSIYTQAQTGGNIIE